MINERMSESHVFPEQIAHILFCSQNTSDLLKFLKLAICLFPLFNEQCEQIAQVAQPPMHP